MEEDIIEEVEEPIEEVVLGVVELEEPEEEEAPEIEEPEEEDAPEVPEEVEEVAVEIEAPVTPIIEPGRCTRQARCCTLASLARPA